MRSMTCFSFLVLIGVPQLSHADEFSFALKKDKDAWQCAGTGRSTAQPVSVAAVIQGDPPAAEVKLAVKVQTSSGEPISGTLARADNDPAGNVWRFRSEAKGTTAKAATLTGTVEKSNIECTAAIVGAPAPVDVVNLRGADFAAATWLDENDGALAAIRARIRDQNPGWPADRIVLLPHLPSGAKAPSYPASISERDLAQVVMVLPTGQRGSIDWTLSRCESIPNYRVYGDLAALGQSRATPPPFEVLRIGHVLTCGADALAYNLGVSSGTQPAEAVPATLPVRPVYHLSAMALFGYDGTRQSTFSVRAAKIAEAIDRIGPGLLAGGAYHVKGVDFGDMRWYNHVLNPFLVVALDAPKDRFVVGTALTYRGGISLGLGVAFNHVPTLATGFSAGQDFSGEGDIPQHKKWERGFFIGVGVDNQLLSSLRKLKKTGTGGGTSGGDQSTETAKTAKPSGDKPDPATKKPPVK